VSYADRKLPPNVKEQLLAALDEAAMHIAAGTINANYDATYEPGGTSFVTLTLKWMRP